MLATSLLFYTQFSVFSLCSTIFYLPTSTVFLTNPSFHESCWSALNVIYTHPLHIFFSLSTKEATLFVYCIHLPNTWYHEQGLIQLLISYIDVYIALLWNHLMMVEYIVEFSFIRELFCQYNQQLH